MAGAGKSEVLQEGKFILGYTKAPLRSPPRPSVLPLYMSRARSSVCFYNVRTASLCNAPSRPQMTAGKQASTCFIRPRCLRNLRFVDCHVRLIRNPRQYEFAHTAVMRCMGQRYRYAPADHIPIDHREKLIEAIASATRKGKSNLSCFLGLSLGPNCL